MRHLELGVGCEHLIVHTADPVPPRPDLTVGHGEKMTPERRSERLEHLLRGIERNAADQNQLVAHVDSFSFALASGVVRVTG